MLVRRSEATIFAAGLLASPIFVSESLNCEGQHRDKQTEPSQPGEKPVLTPARLQSSRLVSLGARSF